MAPRVRAPQADVSGIGGILHSLVLVFATSIKLPTFSERNPVAADAALVSELTSPWTT